MKTNKLIKIHSVLGCLEELKEILALLPSDTPLEFLGNYCDIGPYPNETLDFLIELKSKREITLHKGIHEVFLMHAAGMLDDSLSIKAEWLNPFHGTVKTIADYGVNPWSLVLKNKEQRLNILGEKLKERGHYDLLLSLQPEQNAFVPDAASVVYGHSLKAVDELGSEIQVTAKQNYFEESFCPWIFSQPQFLFTSKNRGEKSIIRHKQTALLTEIDSTPIKNYLSKMDFLWNQNTIRQEAFKELNATKTIFVQYNLLSPASFIPSTFEPTKELNTYIYSALEEIQKKLGVGYWCRSILTYLPANGEVRAHIDPGWPYSVQRRFHWAIYTNPGVEMKVDETVFHMKESEVWELDNKKMHSVFNKGSQGRIHLIADFVPAELARSFYPKDTDVSDYEKRLLAIAARKKKNHLKKKSILRFQYLGGRDYIDVAQITEKFFESRMEEMDPYKISSFKIRIHRPIKHHCELVLSKKAVFNSKSCVAEISCIYEDQTNFWILKETDEKILDSATDPDHYTDPRIQIQNDECVLTEKVCDFSTKALMLMGKALICHQKKNFNPRVASFYFKRPPLTSEIPLLRMRLQSSSNKKFYILQAFVKEELVGRILVYKN